MQRSNPSSHGLSRPLFSFQGAVLWNNYIISRYTDYMVFFRTPILYQTFSDLSRGLLKIFLGNFYQSLNLKEVCIIVVLPPGVEPGWPFSQRILSPLCSYQFHHGSINGAPTGSRTQTN